MECPITIPVYFDGQPICQLQVERQGLYYHFLCRCNVQSPRILRIYAVSGLHVVPLGILMPKDGAFVLDEKISARMWPLDAIDTAVCGHCPESGALPWHGEIDGVTLDGWLHHTSGGYELLLADNGAAFPLPANWQDAEPKVCGDMPCMALQLDEAGQIAVKEPLATPAAISDPALPSVSVADTEPEDSAPEG